MIKLFGRGLLEAEDLASLWVHSRHDMLDGAVLPSSIHCLKNHQDRPGIRGIEPILRVGKFRNILGKRLLGIFLTLGFGNLGVTSPVWIIILESDFLAFWHTTPGDQIIRGNHGEIPQVGRIVGSVLNALRILPEQSLGL